MPRLAWIIPILLAAFLPWSGAMRGIAIAQDQSFVENAAFSVAIVGLLLVGAWIGSQDPWLGLFVSYVATRAAWTSTPYAYETAQYVAFGALLLISARMIPDRWRTPAGYLLTVGALSQIALGTLEWQGYYPPWIGWHPVSTSSQWVHGSFGNPNHLGAFLAITIAVAPWWSLPALAFGLLLSKSALAGLAASVALCLRYRSWRTLGLSLSLSLFLAVLAVRGLQTEPWQDRTLIWRMAAQVASYRPVFGWGPGSWKTIGPMMQRSPEVADKLHAPELWEEVHNEPIQAGFETGIIGLGLLTGALWQKRRLLFHGPWGAAAAAVGVVSLASFPFHVPTLAVLSVTVLGIATAPERSRDYAEG